MRASVHESGEDQVNGVKAVIKASNVRIFGLAPSEKKTQMLLAKLRHDVYF